MCGGGGSEKTSRFRRKEAFVAFVIGSQGPSAILRGEWAVRLTQQSAGGRGAHSSPPAAGGVAPPGLGAQAGMLGRAALQSGSFWKQKPVLPVDQRLLQMGFKPLTGRKMPGKETVDRVRQRRLAAPEPGPQAPGSPRRGLGARREAGSCVSGRGEGEGREG